MVDRNARIVLTAKDDTAAAFAKAKANLKSLQASSAQAIATFGVLGVAVGAAFEAVNIANALEVLDKLDDLAEKSGVATEQLSALRFAGETAGTSFDSLATGLRKLASNMADAAGGGKETAAAFDAIGVNVKTAEGGLKSSSDVLLEVADRFRSYQDGAAKSALAVALFGKAGAEMIPLLNQGSAGIEANAKLARELGAVYSGELAKGAADFNDNLKRLSLAAEAGKVAIAERLLPTLNALSEKFIENAKSSGLFVAGLKAIAEQATSNTAVRAGVDKLGGLQRDAAATSKAIQETTDLLVKFERMDKALGGGGNGRQADALRAKLKALQDQAVKTGEAIKSELAIVDPRESNAETQRLLNRSNAANQKQAPIVDKTTNRDEGLSQFNALIDRIKERVKVDEQQLKVGRQLTEAEKFAIDVETALTGAKSKLSEKQIAVVRARLADVKALDLQLESRALLRAAADADAKAEQDSLELLAQMIDARLQENRGLQDQIAIFGKTASEIELLRTARLEDALAVEQQAIATARANGAGAGELIAMQQKADLLKQQIGLRKELNDKIDKAEKDPFEGFTRGLKTYAEEAAKAGNSTERFVSSTMSTLENGLTDVLTGKSVDAKQIVDSIISEFLRLKVIKPLMVDLFGDGKNEGLIGTFFKSIVTGFGGPKAAGGPVSAGTPYLVGERGREMFVPQQNGTIVPASQGWGQGGGTPVINQVNHFGNNVSQADVMQAVAVGNAQLKGELMRQRSRGTGVFR